MEIHKDWELVCLISVDASANRYRTYSIRIARPTLFHSNFTVALGWGRINMHQKRKEYQFTTEHDMLGCLKNILAKRVKNGYQVIQKSNGFPFIIPLTQNKTISSYPIQATLF